MLSRPDKRVRTHTYCHTKRDAEDDSARQPSAHFVSFVLFCGLLLRVTLDALKHRDIAKVDRMPKRCATVVTRLAFSIRQGAEIDWMLHVNCFWNTQRPR